MPELPEVESIRGGLNAHVAGKIVEGVEILDGRSVRYNEPPSFIGQLEGSRLSCAQRRGKFLWFPLTAVSDGDKPSQASLTREASPDTALLMHLGMSGQALISAEGAADQKHLKVRLTFSESLGQLRFVDQRIFGYLAVDKLRPDRLAGEKPVPEKVLHIAADPLEDAFDLQRLLAIFRSSKRAVKRLLLDQRIVSGIGNIYADEALWDAKIYYNAPANTLSTAQATALVTSVKDVMGRAIERGGTSFDKLYVNVNGSSGYFSRHLNAYGQEGKACPRHEGDDGGTAGAAAIARDTFMNRSSFYCPACQPVGS